MNVLMITCQELGRYLGCYGREQFRTPQLDALAAAGVIFERMFAASPSGSPSQACLFTGCYPHTTGMLGLAHRGWRLDPGQETLTHYLAQGGFRTVQCGFQDEHRLRGELSATELRDVLGYEQLVPTANAQAAAVADAAVDFLRRQAPDSPPFFLRVGMRDVHRPHHGAGLPPAASAQPQLPDHIPDTPATRLDFAHFQAHVGYLDEQVGRVLTALTECQLAEQTLVLMVTDHGSEFNGAKMTFFDPGLEMCCLLRWPGRLPAGHRVSGLASNVDVLPTVLDLLELPLPAPLHGCSRRAAVEGKRETGCRYVYAEKTWHVIYDPGRCLRGERFKLMWHQQAPEPIQPSAPHSHIMGPELTAQLFGRPRGEFELYDLQEDPQEQVSLAANADYVDELAELDNALRQIMEDTDDPLLQDEVPQVEKHPPHHTWNRHEDGTYSLSLHTEPPY